MSPGQEERELQDNAHPEVPTNHDTGLLELPHGWDIGSARSIEEAREGLPRPVTEIEVSVIDSGVRRVGLYKTGT